MKKTQWAWLYLTLNTGQNSLTDQINLLRQTRLKNETARFIFIFYTDFYFILLQALTNIQYELFVVLWGL